MYDWNDTPCCGDDGGYCGNEWGITTDWIDICTCTDFFRISPGCSIDVATGSGGSGDVYTYDESVLVCGYDCGWDGNDGAVDTPGCDAVRSIRVFPTTSNGGNDSDNDSDQATGDGECDCSCYWNGYVCYEDGSGDSRCDSGGCAYDGAYCYDGGNGNDDFGCDSAGDEAGACCTGGGGDDNESDGFFFSSEEMSWYDCADYCDERDANLACPTSSYQNEAVEEMVNDAGIEGAWLGFSDVNDEGEWVCRSTGHSMAWDNWDNGEPNGGGGENCANIWSDVSGRGSGSWNDNVCNDHKLCICREGSADDEHSISTASAANFIVVNTRTDWYSARDYCREHYDDLASIHSDAENDAITEVCRTMVSVTGDCETDSACWIGGNDMSHEGRWAWSDGSAWDYGNWNQGEPNGGDGENLANIWINHGDCDDGRVGKWNDYGDGFNAGAFVCAAKSTYSYAFSYDAGWSGCAVEDLGTLTSGVTFTTVDSTASATCANTAGWANWAIMSAACTSCGIDPNQSVLEEGELRVYRFHVDHGFTFFASTCSDSTDFDSNMALFDENGRLMQQNDDTGDACGECSQDAQHTGWEQAEIYCTDDMLTSGVYILVVGGAESSSGTYGLTIQIDPQFDDDTPETMTCYHDCKGGCQSWLIGSCLDTCIEGTFAYSYAIEKCCYETSFSYGFNPFAHAPCPAQGIITSSIGFGGLDCDDYTSAEDAVVKSAIIEIIDGINKENVGDTACVTDASSLRRTLLDESASATVSFDITVRDAMSYKV